MPAAIYAHHTPPPRRAIRDSWLPTPTQFIYTQPQHLDTAGWTMVRDWFGLGRALLRFCCVCLFPSTQPRPVKWEGGDIDGAGIYYLTFWSADIPPLPIPFTGLTHYTNACDRYHKRYPHIPCPATT